MTCGDQKYDVEFGFCLLYILDNKYKDAVVSIQYYGSRYSIEILYNAMEHLDNLSFLPYLSISVLYKCTHMDRLTELLKMNITSVSSFR